MKPKDEKKIENIFAASLKLISANGIAGLTMAKIAKEAGLATGTLYIYFKSKDLLLFELYESLITLSMERLYKDYDVNKPFKVNAKIFWVNYLKHRIENYKQSVFMEQYYLSPFISEEQKSIIKTLKTPIHALIKQGQKEKLVNENVDNEMLLLSILGFIRELVNEHVSGSYTLDQERIEKAFQFSWDMIKQ